MPKNLLSKLLNNLCTDLGIPKDGSRDSYIRLKEAAENADFIDSAIEDGYTYRGVIYTIKGVVHYNPHLTKA